MYVCVLTYIYIYINTYICGEKYHTIYSQVCHFDYSYFSVKTPSRHPKFSNLFAQQWAQQLNRRFYDEFHNRCRADTVSRGIINRLQSGFADEEENLRTKSQPHEQNINVNSRAHPNRVMVVQLGPLLRPRVP